MFAVGVMFYAFISQVTCHVIESRFNSWYLSDFCGQAINTTGDIELSSQGPSSGGVFALSYGVPHYKPGMNCTVQLVAPGSYKILLSFSQVETRASSLDDITLEIEGVEKTLDDSQLECPKEDCKDYQFTGKRIQLNFSSAPKGTVEPKLVGFSSIVTAYVETAPSTMCPEVQHFRCQNLRCIWQGLYCNGQNNCGDGSDEPSHCPTENIWGILVIVFGAVCFCVFVPLFCFLVLWGGRLNINTTTSKYLPILGDSSSINAMDADNLPVLTESDFLFAAVPQDQYRTARPHSYSLTYGSNAPTVQIHSPAKNTTEDQLPLLSKSLEKGHSPVKC